MPTSSPRLNCLLTASCQLVDNSMVSRLKSLPTKAALPYGTTAVVNYNASSRVNGKGCDMVKGSHKPPSRVRYEQAHPTLSCRLDKETQTALKAGH